MTDERWHGMPTREGRFMQLRPYVEEFVAALVEFAA